MRLSSFLMALVVLVVGFVGVAAAGSDRQQTAVRSVRPDRPGYQEGPATPGRSTDEGLDTADEMLGEERGGELVDPVLDEALLVVEIPPVVVVGEQAAFRVTGPGAATATVDWSFGGVAAGRGNPFVHEFGAAGKRTVQARVRTADELVTKASTVEVVDPLHVELVGADEGRYPVGSEMRLEALLSGGTGPWAMTWTLPDGSTVEGELAEFVVDEEGSVEVSVDVRPDVESLRDKPGLSASASVSIEFYIPDPPDTGSGASGGGSGGGSSGGGSGAGGSDEEEPPPPAPSVSLSGPSQAAPGSVGTYAASGANYDDLLWTASGACSLQSSSGTTASVVMTSVPSGDACVVRVTAVASDGRTASASKSTAVA